MKKVGVALTAGVIALALGVGGTYLVGKYTNNYTNWKPWQSTTSQTSGDSASGTGKTSGNTSEGSGSGQTSKDSTETSSNGGLKALIQGGPKFAAQVNSTKTCTATITPDNATDKTILWTTSDATKVSIATATTQSGAAQTLTLKAVFNGTITITATAEANSAAKVTFSVSVYNFVTTMSLVGFCDTDDTGALDDLSDYVVSHVDSYTYISYSSNTLTYNASTYLYALYELKGRDTTINPDIAVDSTLLGNIVSNAQVGKSGVVNITGSTKKYGIFTLASAGASSAGTVSKTIEDATVTFSTAAYVAPTSMAGTGPVVFK